MKEITPALTGRKAVILITALWIVAILTVFAVSVGRQSAISLKLTSYNVDRLKAYFIARAGILRALAEKGIEFKQEPTDVVDALSQHWANDKDLFCAHGFGEGAYTVGYAYQEEKEYKGLGPEESAPTLYGLMDEQSKININYAPKETLANLIEPFVAERAEAEAIAAAIVDWRDEDDQPLSSDKDNFIGAEEPYYMGLKPPYRCKDKPFDVVYELLLVRGVTPEILDKIKDYITTYGTGRVNINTAGEKVLSALFGPDFPTLASKVVAYRRGNDEEIGTDDDRWFCWGQYSMERGEEGFVEIKNLQDPEWYANIYGITTEEYKRIRDLINSPQPQICTNSAAYRAIATGEVRRVKARIEAVYLFEKKEKPAVVKLWYQE